MNVILYVSYENTIDISLASELRNSVRDFATGFHPVWYGLVV